jgi:hypothetical protein
MLMMKARATMWAAKTAMKRETRPTSVLHPRVHAGAGIPYKYNGIGIRRKDQDLREL